MKKASLSAVLLPESYLGQAIFDLARASGFHPRLLAHPTPPVEAHADRLMLDRWVEAAGDYFGVEAEPVEARFSEIEEMVAKMAPCIVRLPDGAGGHSVIAVVESSAAHVVAILPGQIRRKVPQWP